MTTILLVTRSMIARAQYEGGVVTLRRQARAAGSLIDAIESAAKLGDKLRGPVWILTDDIFTQAISVAAGAIRGLPESEVAKALAFEASTLSGIAAESSQIAWRALPSEGREAEFWVTQIGAPELEQLRFSIAKLGGKLAGVVHPAGLPAALRRRDGAWRRVELWQDLSATIDGNADGVVTVRAGRGDLSRRSPTDIAPSEILLAGTRPAPLRIDADIVKLDDEATLNTWLGGWARILQDRAPSVPVVRPPDRALSQALRIGVFVGGFAAIAALIVLHWLPLRAQRTKLEGDLVRSQEPAKRFADVKKQLDAAEAEASKLRNVEGPAGTGWSRTPARILEVLSSRVPAGLVVDDLETGWDRSVIRGVCKDAVTADRLAEALGQDLAKDNCRVSPALKTLHDPARGQYSFQIDVTSTSTHPSTSAPPRPVHRSRD